MFSVSMPLAGTLQRGLQSIVGASGRQEHLSSLPWVLHRAFEAQAPVGREPQSGMTNADYGVEEAAIGGPFVLHLLCAPEVVYERGLIARHGRPAEGAETERVVKALDRAVE